MCGDEDRITLILTLTLTHACIRSVVCIACVSLTAKGHLMATASEKGTVIRVHTVPESQCVYTFRRGTMRATIQSLKRFVISVLSMITVYLTNFS